MKVYEVRVVLKKCLEEFLKKFVRGLRTISGRDIREREREGI